MNPPRSPAFVCVAEPASSQEILLVHCRLSGTGIAYYIDNEHYGNGLGSFGVFSTRVMVATDRAEEARELLRPVLR